LAKAPSKAQAGKAPLPKRERGQSLTKRIVEKADGRYLIYFEKK